MSSSSHSPKSIESEVKSLKTLLKEVSQAVQLISFDNWRMRTKLMSWLKLKKRIHKNHKNQKKLMHPIRKVLNL